MTPNDVLDRLKAVISTTFAVPPDTLSAETCAQEVQGWDSLGHLVLIAGINSEFGIRLPMAASLATHNLGELRSLVAQVCR